MNYLLKNITGVSRSIIQIAFCMLLITNCQFLFAHGGEDHGEKKKETIKPGQTYFTVNSVSDIFEMVLRFDPIDAGHNTKLKLFVSDFETNKPIDSAQLSITCPDDDKLKFTVKQIDKGTYIIEGTFPENKIYSLVANISAGDDTDLMMLEGIEVGKQLTQAESSEHTETSFFSWETIGAFLAGIIFSLLLFWLMMRRKQITNDK